MLYLLCLFFFVFMKWKVIFIKNLQFGDVGVEIFITICGICGIKMIKKLIKSTLFMIYNQKG